MIHTYRENLIEICAIRFNGSSDNIKEICDMCGATIFGYLESNKMITGFVMELNRTAERYHVSLGDYVAIDRSETIHVYKEGYFKMKFSAIEQDDLENQK